VAQLSGKTALLTGATGGIGLEVARGLLAAGARVVLPCRDEARGQALVRELDASARPGDRIVVRPADLASLASVRELARWAQGELPRLDLLIHNAAVWPRQRRLSADGHELAFAVNHLAPFALTAQLLPLLRQCRARVVTVASGMHGRGKLAWDDLMQAQGGFNGNRAYQQSKLANVMFALTLARRNSTALVSNALHPGVVRTALTREYPELWKEAPPGQTTPKLAAAAILRLAAEPALARVTGRYFNVEREQAPARAALSTIDQDRLWSVSEALVAAARPR
jgi:retinol dehydrogenase 14